MTRSHAFAPACATDALVLILGSLPGQASLAAARYYAHPQNRFWHLVGGMIGVPDLSARDYENRLELLARHRVGLWDTIASAERKGSLDAAIRLSEPAPLAAFVATLPDLRAIGFNGATAARIGRRQLGETGLTLVDLPSSSPAHASMPMSEKQRRWLRLRDFLDGQA